MEDQRPRDCPLCSTPTPQLTLAETSWLAPDVLARLAHQHPGWTTSDGACPACLQQILLQTLLERGEGVLHESIQAVWPLDAEAAFGALPTPLRLHADPRYTGRGVTIAMVDAGFYPHPDLVQPTNRIRAWVDAAHEPVRSCSFGPGDTPRWPGWDNADPAQWHGLMTSAVAAGNGGLSHGLYRGLASEADLVLIGVRDDAGHIGNASIVRALEWIRRHGATLGVRVVNLSLGGDPVWPLAGNPVDEAVGTLVEMGIAVVVAAGNDGERRLVPPATAPAALTIGGLDDKNTFDHARMMLWHSNFGATAGGALKPELVAPSIWVVAPLLPGTPIAAEAVQLFGRRAQGDTDAEAPLAAAKLITPHYQHVDGTSFAAPLVASVVACMLQANPRLTPSLVRDVLIRAAHPIPGVPADRQGAGALDAGQAVALALREQHGPLVGHWMSPWVRDGRLTFTLHEHQARRVRVLGSWDGWREPGLVARQTEPGIWQAERPLPAPGRYPYKFLVDGVRWQDDVDNPHKAPDTFGGLNSVLIVP